MTTEEKNESAKEAFAARLAAAAEKQASFQGRMLEMKSTLRRRRRESRRAQRRRRRAHGGCQGAQRKLSEAELAHESASKNVTDLERRLEETLEQLRETKDALDAKSALMVNEMSGVETTHLSSELDASRERLKLVEMEHSHTTLELKESKKLVASLEGKVAGLEGAGGFSRRADGGVAPEVTRRRARRRRDGGRERTRRVHGGESDHGGERAGRQARETNRRAQRR